MVFRPCNAVEFVPFAFILDTVDQQGKKFKKNLIAWACTGNLQVILVLSGLDVQQLLVRTLNHLCLPCEYACRKLENEA